MSADKPSIHTKVQTIAAVLGVLVAIFGVAITWYYARTPSVRAEEETRSVPPKQEPSPEQPSSTTAQASPRDVEDSPRSEGRRLTETASPPREEGGSIVRGAPGVPIELTLQNGEQRAILSDQASLAAEFTRIGTEEIVTLRVNAAGGQSASHAILGAGARFELTSAGEDYFIYVLRVDSVEETVQLRVARAL